MKKDKPNGIQLLIRTVVRDPDGKVLSDTGQTPAKSFVIQFLEFIGFLGRGADDPTTATDVAGAETDIYSDGSIVSSILNIDAAVNDGSHGIVVGTGDTGVTNTDNKLETQLTEGIGGGQITHGEVVIGSAAEVGANVDMELTRVFTNNTGSEIVVKEAGIYSLNTVGTRIHCIIRDVLGEAAAVADKCSLTVIYTWRTTV